MLKRVLPASLAYAGALLVVPLTAGLVILCRHFDSTAWVAALIARDE